MLRVKLVLYCRTKDRRAYDFRAGSMNRPGWLYLPLLYGWKNGTKPDGVGMKKVRPPQRRLYTEEVLSKLLCV